MRRATIMFGLALALVVPAAGAAYVPDVLRVSAIQRIHIAISLFHEHQLLTLILAIYVIVTPVDALSAWLRARLV